MYRLLRTALRCSHDLREILNDLRLAFGACLPAHIGSYLPT